MKQPCLYCGETRDDRPSRRASPSKKAIAQLFADYLDVALVGIETRLAHVEESLSLREDKAPSLLVEVQSLGDELGRIEAHLGRLGIEIPQKRVQHARSSRPRRTGKNAAKKTSRRKATVKT